MAEWLGYLTSNLKVASSNLVWILRKGQGKKKNFSSKKSVCICRQLEIENTTGVQIYSCIDVNALTQVITALAKFNITPAKPISAPAHYISTLAQPPATGVIMYLALFAYRIVPNLRPGAPFKSKLDTDFLPPN